MAQDDRFEWDDTKAKRNLKKHETSFAAARKVFDDPASVDLLDDREDYGEERSIRIGMAGGRLLAVTYTKRAHRIRIISARKATKREQDEYYTQGA